MSLNELRKLSGLNELLEISKIDDEHARLKSVHDWFKRRVREYHVDFSVDLATKKHLKSDYDNFLEHNKKKAAFQIGEALLKDKMILCDQIVPSEDEYIVSKFQWWKTEERYRLDCNVYFNLY